MATGEQMRFIHIPALANDAAPGYGLFEDFPSYVKEFEASQTAADGGCSVARREFLDSFKDETNAGAAGREFVLRLLAYFDKLPNGARDYMQQARAELASYANDERWQELSHTAMRVFAGFNLIALGGRLAARLGILPWQEREIDAAVFGCFDAWRLSDQNPEANYERFSRAQASEQQNMGVFYAHYDRKGTRVLTEAERVPNDGLLGALILDAETGAAAPEKQPELNSPVLAFVYAPEQFRKLVSRIGGGLNVRECAKTLRKRQRLYGNDKTKTPPYHPHRKSRPHFGMQGGGAYYVVIPMTDDVTKAAGRLNEALSAARQAGAN
jgi:hypothetical protein